MHRGQTAQFKGLRSLQNAALCQLQCSHGPALHVESWQQHGCKQHDAGGCCWHISCTTLQGNQGMMPAYLVLSLSPGSTPTGGSVMILTAYCPCVLRSVASFTIAKPAGKLKGSHAPADQHLLHDSCRCCVTHVLKSYSHCRTCRTTAALSQSTNPSHSCCAQRRVADVRCTPACRHWCWLPTARPWLLP